MKKYIIQKVPEGQSIDWSTIPALSICEVAWDKAAEGVEAWAQLCYNSQNLYVKLSAKEKDIVANRTEPLDFPNFDSCLEFFVSPVEDDSRYFNFECNPNGLMYQGMGHDVSDLVRFIPLYPNIFPKVERTEDGWNVTYAITEKYITQFFTDFSFTSGRVLRGNFYKCGDDCPVPHYYSWNPVTIETPCFHYTADFGELILA